MLPYSGGGYCWKEKRFNMPPANQSQHSDPTLDSLIIALAARLKRSHEWVKKEFNLSFFTFNIEFLPATLSAFTTGSFIVQNDSAFVLCKTSYIATLATDNKTPVTAVTVLAFFSSSRRRHTRSFGDWSSDVCSSDLRRAAARRRARARRRRRAARSPC